MKQNYIIVNGVPSWEIDGLVILKYPPIVRAPMRIEEEQVDSRHGSVITSLGYDAYDRTLEIGLVGEYDINRAIDYFGLGGQIIFGNEPDRRYTVMIAEAISFERLVRNRKASITMHCQPFKYQVSEQATVLAGDGEFTNYGNVTSAPLYHIWGSGKFTLALNSSGVTLDMTNDGELFIDTEELEAFDQNGALKNSRCAGSYTALRAVQGKNQLTVAAVDGETFSVEKIEITKKTRWI